MLKRCIKNSTLLSECLAQENHPNFLKSLGHRPWPRVLLILSYISKERLPQIFVLVSPSRGISKWGLVQFEPTFWTYFSSSRPCFWVLGTATSVYFLLVEFGGDCNHHQCLGDRQLTTVEQEKFATWKIREFEGQTIRVHEIFANSWLGELLSFPTVVSD